MQSHSHITTLGSSDDRPKRTDLNRHLEDLWGGEVGEGDGLRGSLLRVEAGQEEVDD